MSYLFYSIRKTIFVFLLSLTMFCSSSYAKSLDHVRHLLINNMPYSVQYDLHSINGIPFQFTGLLGPGETKELDCQDAVYSAYATYILQVRTTFGFSRTANKLYKVKNDIQLIWSIDTDPSRYSPLAISISVSESEL